MFLFYEHFSVPNTQPKLLHWVVKEACFIYLAVFAMNSFPQKHHLLFVSTPLTICAANQDFQMLSVNTQSLELRNSDCHHQGIKHRFIQVTQQILLYEV